MIRLFIAVVGGLAVFFALCSVDFFLHWQDAERRAAFYKEKAEQTLRLIEANIEEDAYYQELAKRGRGPKK